MQPPKHFLKALKELVESYREVELASSSHAGVPFIPLFLLSVHVFECSYSSHAMHALYISYLSKKIPGKVIRIPSINSSIWSWDVVLLFVAHSRYDIIMLSSRDS